MLNRVRIISILLLITACLLSGKAAEAADESCSWQNLSISYTTIGGGVAAGTTQIQDACPAGTGSVSESTKCLESKPAGSSVGCCCVAVDSAALAKSISTTKTPQFNIPDFQIKIPTVSLTSAACSTTLSGTECKVPWISQYIFGIYKYALNIGAIIAVIILMIAGLLWIVSGGNADRISKAKRMIAGALAGLFLLVASSLILNMINPELVNEAAVSIKYIDQKIIEGMAENRNGNVSNVYKNMSCPTDQELQAGVQFYSTGYYKPPYENSSDFFCVVAMQCTCPNGQDTTKNCDQLYGKTYPGYHPCKYFDSSAKYCNMTSGGTTPKAGDIAGPSNCSNLGKGTKICYGGKAYTITDTGGGIKGRRIDIWSGNDIKQTYANTKIATVKLPVNGQCN